MITKQYYIPLRGIFSVDYKFSETEFKLTQTIQNENRF